MTTTVNHQSDTATGFWSHVRASLPRPSARNCYYGTVMLAGLLLFVTQAPQPSGTHLVLIALSATELALSMMPVRVYGSSTVYVSFVVTLVIIAQFGLPGVVFLAPLDALRTPRRGNAGDFTIKAFNAGMYTIVYCADALVF